MFMKTMLAAALSCGLMAMAAQASEVNVNHWSDFLAAGTVQDFETQSKIKVNFSVADSLDTLQTKLIVGGTGYDVVSPSHTIGERLVNSNLLYKLDKSKLPNLRNLDESMMAKLATVDPGNDHLVPFAIVATLLAFNETKVRELLGEKAELDSLALLFDPANAEKLKSCKINLFDTPAPVFSMALTYLGLNPGSENPKDYQAAFNALKKIRPYVAQFNESTYLNDLAGGDICITTAWSSDALIARDRAKEAKRPYTIGYSIPKEGTATDFAVLAIPKDAPHPDAAMAWINFLLDPTVSARNTNELRIATINEAARPQVNAETLAEPVVSLQTPNANVFYLSKTPSAKIMRLQNQLWSQLKLGN